eukprot:1160788-Pelagomonas_calceolata.AAC.5
MAIGAQQQHQRTSGCAKVACTWLCINTAASQRLTTAHQAAHAFPAQTQHGSSSTNAPQAARRSPAQAEVGAVVCALLT